MKFPYSVNELTKAGWLRVTGGAITLVVTFVVWTIKYGFENAVLTNLVGLAFGASWFIFNVLSSIGFLKKIQQGLTYGGGDMNRLSERPTPSNYYRTREQAQIVIACLMIVVIVFALPDVTVSVGAFVAGFWFGGGFGLLRFVNKVAQIEVEQERSFYFSETSNAPRTDVAFYDQHAPVEPEVKAEVASLAAPRSPVAKRRTTARIQPSNPNPNARPKAQPLVPTPTNAKPDQKKEL